MGAPRIQRNILGEGAGEMRRKRPVRPRPRTQLAPAEMETNRQERLQYDRQRDQTPEGRESRIRSNAKRKATA